MYSPALAFWFTVFQLIAAPFKFDIGFPPAVVEVFAVVGSVLYVEVPLPSAGSFTLLGLLALLIVADVVLLTVPAQHLHVALGGTAVLSMHTLLVLKQTFLFIPICKFLISAWACKHGHSAFVEAACAGPQHATAAFAAAVLLLAMVGVGITYARSQHDDIAQARRGLVLPPSSQKNVAFALAMMALKATLALVLGVLGALLPTTATVAILLVLAAAAAVIVSLTQPFFSCAWTAMVISGLACVMYTDLVTLISTGFGQESDAAPVLATIWLALMFPIAWLTRAWYHDRHKTALEAEVTHQLCHPKRQPPGPDRTSVAGPGNLRVADFSRLCLGLSRAEWGAFYSWFATNHPAEAAGKGVFADFSGNGLNPEQSRLLLGAASTNSALRIAGLSFKGNKSMLARADQARSPLACPSVVPATNLSSDGQPALSLGGLDAFLVQYTPLTKLDLSHIPLSPGTLDTLVTALVHSRVAQLSLAHCGLTPLHGAALARLLSDSTTLTHLNLTGNEDLAPAGAELMAPGIAHCTARGQLQHLDVSWCGLQLQGATAVLNAVNRDGCAALPKPLALHMHCNDIPFQTFAQLKGQLSQLLSAGLPASTTLAEQAEANEAALAEVLGGKTIYEAIGGAPAVHAVVDTFYIFLVSHPATAPFFKNVAMGRMRHLQETFISTVLGAGDVKYSGKDMAAGHAHLGITDDVFDQTVALLVSAILHHLPEAPVPILHKLLAVVETLREPVVDGSTRGEDASEEPVPSNLLVEQGPAVLAGQPAKSACGSEDSCEDLAEGAPKEGQAQPTEVSRGSHSSLDAKEPETVVDGRHSAEAASEEGR